MRLKKSGWSCTLSPRFLKIPSSSARVIAASTSSPLGQADAGVDDRRVLAVQRLEIARFGLDRRGDGREIGNQLGIVVLDRLDDDGTGTADHGAAGSPLFLTPEVEVLLRDQLVPQDATVHRAESYGVACVYDLFRGRGIEPGGRLDRQDEHRFAAQREFERAGGVADGDDGFVGTGGHTQAHASAGLVDNPDLLLFDRYGIRRADAHAGQARDAQLRIDSKIHTNSGRALESLVIGTS